MFAKHSSKDVTLAASKTYKFKYTDKDKFKN